MESDSTIPWVALAISGTGFFLISFVESSLASVRRDRAQWLVAHGVPGAIVLEGLHSTPLGPTGSLTILKYVLLGTNLMSSIGVGVLYGDMDWNTPFLIGASSLVISGLLYIKAYWLAGLCGEKSALRLARPARILFRMLRPLTMLYLVVGNGLSRPKNEDLNMTDNGIPDQLGIGIDSTDETLDEHEARMIRGVVDLDRTTAREIMVPRLDMVTVEIGVPITELVHLMIESGHSRIPVTLGSLDKIEGIVYSREVLASMVNEKISPEVLNNNVVRDALFIPESKTLEELLEEFQHRQLQIAIVVDEYGGVSGLVTIEDLLEEIVGEITDEFDIQEPDIERQGGDSFLIDARIGLDSASELLGTTFQGDGFDTLGGFIYQRLGRIPKIGDLVDHEGLEIQVVATVGRRVKQVRVEKTTPSDSD